MSKYLKGSKRLAIIQRWLQGIDDPNYDVLPTKKEGKYIVKKKQQPDQQADNEDEQEEQHEVEQQDEQQSEQESQPQPKPKPPVRKLPPQPPQRKPQLIQRNRFSQQPQVDSTVNLEILEQLKLLGDEIRTKRERKEQKQLIKQVVQKQLRTQPPPMNESHVIAKSKPVEEYEYYSDDEEQPVVFKSRIFH